MTKSKNHREKSQSIGESHRTVTHTNEVKPCNSNLQFDFTLDSSEFN